MPGRRAPADEGPSLLDLLEEQEHGPPPCAHNGRVGPKHGSGWAQELDPASPYYGEWVHNVPWCRRSAVPGTKNPLPKRKWSRELQKDVPIHV